MQDMALAPGSRVLIRDEEWIVRRVDDTSTGAQALSVTGLSELVKEKESIFLTDIDTVQVIKPEDTRSVTDSSPRYIQSRLYIESLLRQTPPKDNKLYISQYSVIDNNSYQFDPALETLKHPRQRILLADGVGLGKTIEAGIILTELIKRGKGKRILVAVVKSMLTQFQKELWARFTIPLVRLDSTGIQRIRGIIPSNANPFYYYDKTIISIDTLKQDATYRTYLENSYWDIIVIDECHNVAIRGKSKKSQRSRLAELLSKKSDTLILASATPHDGKPESFASLMNMLDPTAIADPKNYTKEEIKGLFFRRFKKDILEQVRTAFKDRKPAQRISTEATEEEERAFDYISELKFERIDAHRSGGEHLFKTILTKSIFSSPAACIDTVKNRIKRLAKENNPSSEKDREKLEQLEEIVREITPDKFSKYQKLIYILKDSELRWSGRDSKDRLIIFTERIETLRFLRENLLKDLKLKEDEIVIFHGGLSDNDQQDIVDKFGKLKSPIRLLLASDVASEGINLHFYCHKMIHFDIPWSLMTFQQRNGRIDRYGQEREPLIYYLITNSYNQYIKGDTRILEILVEKEEQAVKNIGDPASLLGVYSEEGEEEIVAKAIESGAEDEFEKLFAKLTSDPLKDLTDDYENTGKIIEDNRAESISLFENDFEFFKKALEFIRDRNPVEVTLHPQKPSLSLRACKEIEQRFKYLPKEIEPANWEFILTTDRDEIKKEYKECRTEENTWPKIHILWDLHPVAEWINDKLSSKFGRHEAPVIYLPEKLQKKELVVLLYGVIPNKKSQPVITNWFGVSVIDGTFNRMYEIEELIEYTGINTDNIPSIKGIEIDHDEIVIDILEAVKESKRIMSKLYEERVKDFSVKLEEQRKRLERLRGRQLEQLEFVFETEEGQSLKKKDLERKDMKKRLINELFDEHEKWVEDTLKIKDNPYIKVVAIFKG
ncbi:MAG: helicase-related protein [Candidatus Eremiobacterota bacterium]